METNNANRTSLVNSHRIEGGLMFTMAVIGGVGNLGVILAILCCRKFRSSVTAFLCHHSLLDFLKAIYCIPFGYSLLHGKEPSHCNLIGASYIVIVTTSAYNLLGLIVNEEYQLTDYGQKGRQSNYCCVLFGVFMIWFMSILLNLGVAFIPGNAEYNYDIGNCIFLYGIPNNFVLHVLWMVLMTIAILLAYICAFILYRKIVRRSRGHKWAYIHRSISRDMNSRSSSMESINADSDDDVLQPRECYAHLHLRRVVIIASLATAFVVFWYPLFILTLADPKYEKPRNVYQAFTILAWSQPIITPIFSILILYDIGCSSRQITRDVYVNEIPLQTTNEMTDHMPPHLTFSWNTADNVIYNEHFASENQPHISLPPRLAMAEDSSIGTPTSSRRPSTLDYRRSTTTIN